MESEFGDIDRPRKSCPLALTLSLILFSRAKFIASCTCSGVVAFTTYAGYPPLLHGAFGSGIQLSLFQLLYALLIGSSSCNVYEVNQAVATAAQFVKLK